MKVILVEDVKEICCSRKNLHWKQVQRTSMI